MPKTPVSVDTTAWSVVTPRFPDGDALPAFLAATCPVSWLVEGAPFCLSLAETEPNPVILRAAQSPRRIQCHRLVEPNPVILRAALAGVRRHASLAILSLVSVLDSPLTPHHLKGLVVP